jgi:hypothetical protein
MGKGEQMSQILQDIKECGIDQTQAQALRVSADRFELRNQPITALLFRNAAYALEHETKQTGDTQIKKERQ